MAIDTTKPVVRDGSRFCGPTVVAAILGTSTAQVAAEVAQIRCAVGGMLRNEGLAVKRTRAKSADKVRGCTPPELFALLARHGVTVAPVDVGAGYARSKTGYVSPDGKRLANSDLFRPDWSPFTVLKYSTRPLWQVLLKLQRGAYIIQTPGHWILAADGKLCETFTHGQWVDFRAAPKTGRGVQFAWRVTA